MIKKRKYQFFKVFAFLAFLFSDFNILLQKQKNWETYIFTYFGVPPNIFELQRHIISHFKDLDQYFCPLA